MSSPEKRWFFSVDSRIPVFLSNLITILREVFRHFLGPKFPNFWTIHPPLLWETQTSQISIEVLHLSIIFPWYSCKKNFIIMDESWIVRIGVFPFQLYHLDELSMLQESAEKVNADFPADSLLGVSRSHTGMDFRTHCFSWWFQWHGFVQKCHSLVVSNLPF